MLSAMIVIAVLFLLYLFLIFPALRRHGDRVLMKGMYVAHRGLHSKELGAPENSMNAFALTKKLGFCIETDIHLTKDGEVVVFHDDTTGRMCEKDLSIEESTLAELKELHLAGTDQTIPTLKELLAFVDEEVPLLIEFKCVKGNSAALCAAADKILSEYHGKYIVQSFYPPVLWWYRLHRKGICRGQLSRNFLFHEKKDRKFLNVLSGWLLFNFLARPDFVSYDVQDAGSLAFGVCKLLGAFPVGWTITSDEQLVLAKHSFSTYIFENILPPQPYE